MKGIRPSKPKIDWFEVFFVGGLLAALVYAIYKILQTVGIIIGGGL
jgi:hypothetical protein